MGASATTLLKCLEAFAATETVTDVSCASCGIKEMLRAVEEKIDSYEDATACCTDSDVMALRRELRLWQRQKDVLLAIDPDSDGAAEELGWFDGVEGSTVLPI